MTSTLKKCTCCGHWKPWGEFYRRKGYDLSADCRECSRARAGSRSRALSALADRHRTEYEHLLLLARRGEL